MKTIVHCSLLLLVIMCFMLGLFGCCDKTSQRNDIENYSNSYPLKSRIGIVPDKNTAIKIAEAIWLPIYGDIIYQSAPFVAKLQDSIWVVKGTVPKGREGGAPYIEINKASCEILKVIHTK